MIDLHSFAFGNRFGRDLYTSSHNAERVLNAAILRAEICRSFEEYVDIFEAFYADDIELSSETQAEPIRGKDKVRSVLLDFLVPLHVMSELGDLLISLRQSPIPGDAANETHSAWTLHLNAPSGESRTLTWCTLRKWNGSRVVCERHYDYGQSGSTFTFDDFRFNRATRQ